MPVQLLHARCTDLKAELRAVMLKHGIKSMRLVPVKRNYAFEDPAIPTREQWVIKVCQGRGGTGRGELHVVAVLVEAHPRACLIKA